MRRPWLVLIATAAMMVFAQATVFSSLGIVLFAMARDFHWSDAAAGGAFTVLVLTCCVSHLAPVPLIARIGGRWTIVSGGAVMAFAFLVAALTQNLATAYVAAGLLGIGFSLVANTPAIYLIAGWFGRHAPRSIGLYMMIGTLGGAAGPPVAQALIAGGGWRFYWAAMLAGAVLLIGLCAVLIREPELAADAEGRAAAHADWRYWEILRSPQFVIIAIAMVLTQTCIITVASVTPSHLARLGWPAGFAGQILGIEGLVGTLSTGLSGWLSERIDGRLMLGAGLLAEAAGMLLLGFADSTWMIVAFALAFGMGWSVSCLAVTVLLVRIFGNRGGTAALATIFTFAGAAAAGPWAAGQIADATGSFSLTLGGLGLLLLPAALAAFLMNSARRIADGVLAPQLQTD